MNVLEVKFVSKSFGGIKAIDNLSFTIREGIITSLIGPNGAGKTTLFNIITGFIRPDTGKVIYNNIDITNLMPYEIANLGIGRLWQDIRIFKNLTVLENMLLCKGLRTQREVGENPFISFFLPKKIKEENELKLSIAKYWLEFVELLDKKDTLAENLSYGQQKLLAIARVLAGGSKLLLLDEPASGIHPEMIKKIQQLLRKLVNEGLRTQELQTQGVTILIIEHNMRFVTEISDWVMVLDNGKLVLFGKPDEIMEDPTLEEIYLGV